MAGGVLISQSPTAPPFPLESPDVECRDKKRMSANKREITRSVAEY